MAEVLAAIKGTMPDTCYALRNRDVGQSSAKIERIVADPKNAAVGRNHTVFAAGDQCFASFVNEG